MFGRKRIPSLKECSLSVSEYRPWPLTNLLKEVIDAGAVYGRLPRKQSGFSEVIILGEMTPQEGSAACAYEGIRGIVRDLKTAVQLIWFVRHLP